MQNGFKIIQHPFMIKALKKEGKERMYLAIAKIIYGKPIANIILNREKLKPFPLKSGMRRRCSNSPLTQDSTRINNL
jgi:hypothetical protein